MSHAFFVFPLCHPDGPTPGFSRSAFSSLVDGAAFFFRAGFGRPQSDLAARHVSDNGEGI